MFKNLGFMFLGLLAAVFIFIPVTNVDAAEVYTVQVGDSLSVLAEKHGVTVVALQQANNISGTTIYAGKKLTIPSNNVNTTTNRGAVTIRTSSSVPPEKLDLLARIISAEAKGESYNTQVAVGAVILNRVKSSNFPNSIPEVINQKSSGVYQFSPVANGAINNPATESAKKAAIDAVNGADPSNGALFFFESNTTNKWLLAKPVSAKIGALVFAK